MKTKGRWKTWLFGILITAAIGVALVLALQGRAKADDEGPVVTVARDTLHIRVEEIGIVEPFRKVEITSKVAGQVQEVLVDVGARVKAGDVLVRLDPRDTTQSLRRSQAEHRVNRVMLDQAQRLLGFKQEAHRLGVLSDLELAASQGEVQRLDAQNAVYAAASSQLQDQVECTRLRAPIDGLVLARHVEPGEMVTPGVAAMVDGKPLLVVAQVDRLLVRTELNQLDVALLSVGQKVEVRVDALPGAVFPGEVFRIAAMAQKSERRPDSRLQVFPVDVVIDGKAAAGLRPGMIADLRVDVESHENVLAVPLEAIVYEAGSPHLRKLEGEKERLTPVVLGKQNTRLAQVVSGVDEGDRLRVRPADTKARNKD